MKRTQVYSSIVPKCQSTPWAVNELVEGRVTVHRFKTREEAESFANFENLCSTPLQIVR